MFKKLTKNILYGILRIINFRANGAIVLMYHSVDSNDEFFTVSPNQFKKQIEYLKENNFRVIKPSEFLDIIETKGEFLPKTILITFDDGYEDFYLNAFPILKMYSFPALVFVNTAFLGSTRFGRRKTKLNILSPAKIQEMAESDLIEFGSHGYNHVKLSKISDNALEQELLISKRILENLIRKEVFALAYPYGDFDKRVMAVAGRYYKLAFSVQNGPFRADDDRLSIKRNSIDSQTSFNQFKGIIDFGRI